jgi:hypothetical protein
MIRQIREAQNTKKMISRRIRTISKLKKLPLSIFLLIQLKIIVCFKKGVRGIACRKRGASPVKKT